MKDYTLFLMRHAKAEKFAVDGSDFSRPLSSYGRLEAYHMAQQFEQHHQPVGLIISSPATRALQTAEIFASRYSSQLPEIRLEGKIYEASIFQLLQVICALPTSMDRVLLVGHNPALAQIVHYLTSQPIDMPTGSIVQIQMSANNWQWTTENSCRLIQQLFANKK